MTDIRIPTHLEVGGLLRQVQAAGGFGMVLHKGEADAGTLLVVCTEKGLRTKAYERMPQADGTRAWSLSKEQDTENIMEFSDYLDRRARQDDDLWIIELDIAGAERFIGLKGSRD